MADIDTTDLERRITALEEQLSKQATISALLFHMITSSSTMSFRSLASSINAESGIFEQAKAHKEIFDATKEKFAKSLDQAQELIWGPEDDD